GERAEAAPLDLRLDDRDRHAMELALVEQRVEVAHVADRPPHDVDEALREVDEGSEKAAEASLVWQLACDRREAVYLGGAAHDRPRGRAVQGDPAVDVPVTAVADGREEHGNRVAGPREGAQLAPARALGLAAHLARATGEVENDELEAERARQNIPKIDEPLDGGRQAIHAEQRIAPQRVLAQARGDDLRHRPQLA